MVNDMTQKYAQYKNKSNLERARRRKLNSLFNTKTKKVSE